MLTARLIHRPYVFALAAVLSAALMRALLDPFLGDQLPFYLFYFAVMAASVWGGLGPGLAALFMGFITAAYFFVFPRYAISFDQNEDVFGAFRYISIGTALVLGGTWANRLRERWLAEARARRSDQEALKTSEVTANTLASIGDGLITVDPHGRVTFMNAVAEELTGWDARAVKGQDIMHVFRIVHADTRQPVPDPVWRSLREKRVVTLPEHTVLIGKDGRERPIDDSAAPIIDGSGHVTGSVLVFREVVRQISKETRAFDIEDVELFPAPGEHRRLTEEESHKLQHACRTWVEREWVLNEHASRMISLAGFELIVRQSGMMNKPSGLPEVRFLVLYSRLGAPVE